MGCNLLGNLKTKMNRQRSTVTKKRWARNRKSWQEKDNMEEISTLENENENYPFTFHFTTSFVEKKPRQKTIQVKALFMGNKYMCCILHCHFYHINRSLDVL